MSGILSFLGRVMLCAIFFVSAVAYKIPKYDETAAYMHKAGIPQPKLMLGIAIGFLIIGSISVVLGFHARCGAFLLLVFLAVTSHYFHAFWKEIPDTRVYQEQVIQFQKNLAIAGAMLFIIANGAGAGSIDSGRS